MMTKKQIGTLFLASVMAASMLISFPLASHAASRPKAPTLKVHVHPSNKVDLKWNKVKADSYRIYRKQDKEKKYTFVKKTVKTKTTVKNNKISYYIVKSVKNGITSKASNRIKVLYYGKSHSLTIPNNGHRITVGKTYPASYFGENRSGRTIRVDDTGIWDNGTIYIYGTDVKTKGEYFTSIYKKGAYRNGTFKYDALSTYNKDHSINTNKKWEKDYFIFLGNFDESNSFQIKDPSIVVYETIDGSAPTPNNYYMKITKADGRTNTFAWEYKRTGYDWFRAYKNGKLMWEDFDPIKAR